MIRGYLSTQDDLLRRDIIQQLTCHFRLDTQAIARNWNIDFKRYFAAELTQLADMIEDGLLTIDDDEIVVQQAGRILVRNICMIFDRFQQQATTPNAFSRTI